MGQQWVRVRFLEQGRSLTTLDAEGRVLATNELDRRVSLVFVDADGRIWAKLRPEADGWRGYVALDRRLNELFRVEARNIFDASSNRMLALQRG